MNQVGVWVSGLSHRFRDRLRGALTDSPENDRSQSSAEHLRRAIERCHRGECEAALVDAEKAILQNPLETHAYFVRAVCFVRRDDIEAAAAEMTRLIRLEGPLRKNKPVLSLAYQKRGDYLQTLGRLREASADYDRAVELGPANADAYCSRGIIWCILGEYAAAERDLAKAVELNPQDDRALSAIGWLHFDRREFENATAMFDRALAIRGDADAYVGRACALIESHRIDAALSDSEAAVAMEPDNPSTFAVRAWARYHLRQFERAKRDFEEAIRLFEESESRGCVFAYYGYAWLLSTCAKDALRDGPRALHYALETEKADHVRDWQVAHLLAVVYAELGRFAEAETSQRRALNQAPSDAVPQLQRILRGFEQRQPYRGEDEEGRVWPMLPELLTRPQG